MHPTTTAAVVLLLCAAPGLAQQAYLNKLSAAPGERVRVHLSASSGPISVWRSRYFGQDTQVLQRGPFSVPAQSWTHGSYAEVPTDPQLEITSPLTLEAWIQPLGARGNFQGILSKYSIPNHTAYMIYLLPSGQLSFYLGATGVFSQANRTLTTNPIATGRWTHVVATYDGQNKRIYLNGQLDVTAPRTGPIFNTTQPVRIAAYGLNGSAGEFFNGHIDSPAIYGRVLTPDEIAQRFAERADYTNANPGVLAGAVAQWNFGELDGTTLADATGNGHDLTLHNYGTRGVAGPSPRPGPQASHSIRFSEQDLYNPVWPSPFSFVIEPSWQSGFYYVQVGGAKLPLIVKPRPSAKRRIAVLAATNTWLAYNGWSGNSLYSRHASGPISYYVGMRQPNPGAHVSLHTPGSGISHLVDAERYLYKWLDDNGRPFDLYTDLDLHQAPDLLDDYDVLMLNGHSEYWSHEMIDHVVAFQNRGGSLVNLSGNTMWTVVTYDPTFSVIEGRKHPHGSGTIPADERWHSQAGGILGGTLRCIGRPEHEVIGVGYGIGGGAARGWGVVLQPAHWVFAGTGVSRGTKFGEAGLNGGSMMGFEVDVIDPLWTPANAQVIAVGHYPTPTFQLGITNCQTRTSWTTSVGGEVLYYDHPGGGGVFGIPAVTAGGSLVVDPIATRMLNNVLDRFLTPASCRFRYGSGVNPIGFTCVTLPVLGTPWESIIATTPGTVSTYLGLAASPGLLPWPGGEILLGLVPAPVFQSGMGAHSLSLPNNRVFVGAELFAQGFRIDLVGGTPTVVFLNGQDLRLGARRR